MAELRTDHHQLLFLYDRFGGGHQGQAPKMIESPPSNWISGVEYHSKLPSRRDQVFRRRRHLRPNLEHFLPAGLFQPSRPARGHGRLLGAARGEGHSCGRSSAASSRPTTSAGRCSSLTATPIRIAPTTPGPTIRSRAASGASRSRSNPTRSKAPTPPRRTSTLSRAAIRNGTGSSSAGRTCWR